LLVDVHGGERVVKEAVGDARAGDGDVAAGGDACVGAWTVGEEAAGGTRGDVSDAAA
jgi:hypothetical protein